MYLMLRIQIIRHHFEHIPLFPREGLQGEFEYIFDITQLYKVQLTLTRKI